MIYTDPNGDGAHQEDEAAVTKSPALAPGSGQFPILLRVQIPAKTAQRHKYSFKVIARSKKDASVLSEASTTVTVVAPLVRIRTEQITRGAAAGEAIFYRLVLFNQGNGAAKNLTVTEQLADYMQFASSDPAPSQQEPVGLTQRLIFRLAELEAGETAVLRVAVRLRPNAPAEGSLTTRHSVLYQDSRGNSYPK